MNDGFTAKTETPVSFSQRQRKKEHRKCYYQKFQRLQGKDPEIPVSIAHNVIKMFHSHKLLSHFQDVGLGRKSMREVCKG